MTQGQSAGGPAPADRRFHAFVVDRVVGWGAVAAAGAAAWWWGFREDRTALGIGLIVVMVLLVSLATALATGLRGVTPGKALLGLRVVDAATGGPIGVPRALLRTTILGLASLPTLGLGLAGFAASAIADPTHRRRGWHDRSVGSVVLDVVTGRVAAGPVGASAPEMVNLTAMRLAQVPAPLLATPEFSSAPPAPPHSNPPSPPAPATGAAPGPNTAAPALDRTARVAAGWRLRFDSGDLLSVDGLVLIGRNPEARPGEPARHVVPLASQDMSLSKTHAQIHLASDGTLVVTDRGSTNGSILMRHGVSRDLTAGRPATLLAGDRVLLGDRELLIEMDE